MNRPVTRIGDADIPHCSGMTRAQGSRDCLTNDRRTSLRGHINTGHLRPVPGLPPCRVHVAPIAMGSSMVFVNDVGIGRIGDAVAGCTAVAEGSPDTLAG